MQSTTYYVLHVMFVITDLRTFQYVLFPSIPTVCRFGETPCTVNCPTCHNEVNSRVGYETGTLTWLLVLLLFLLGFVFPILWLWVVCVYVCMHAHINMCLCCVCLKGPQMYQHTAVDFCFIPCLLFVVLLFNDLSPVSCLPLCSWILYCTCTIWLMLSGTALCTEDCRQCNLRYTHTLLILQSNLGLLG